MGVWAVPSGTYCQISWERVGCCYDRSISHCNYVKGEFKLHCNHTCIDGTDGTDTYTPLINQNLTLFDLLTEKELNCMVNRPITFPETPNTFPNSTECGMRGCQWASSAGLCIPSCQYNTITECGTKRHCMYTNGIYVDH